MKNRMYEKYLTTHPFYANKKTDPIGSFRFFDQNYLRFIPLDKNARILDVGSGTGDFLAYLKSKEYKNFLGVDIAEEQVDFCKKYVTKNVSLITNLSVFLKSKKNTFDFILMNDIIEHIEKDQVITILSLVKESLTADGTVLIRTVNLKNRWGMAVRYMDFTHTVGFTEESLRQIMLTSGFKKTVFIQEIHPIHDLKSFVRVILKSFFEFFYRLEYIASFGDFHPMLSNMLIAIGKKA